jgi:SAM-dependent methyltransferase
MVGEALARNAAAVARGQVAVMHGKSEELPFEAASFDAALALNVICFWPSPERDLSEPRRVLKRGGRLVLGVLAPWCARDLPVFRHGFTFHDWPKLAALLADAGFSASECEILKDEAITPDGKLLERDYFVIRARA